MTDLQKVEIVQTIRNAIKELNSLIPNPNAAIIELEDALKKLKKFTE